MKKFIFSIFVLAGVGVPLLFTPFLFSGFELGKAVLLRLVTVVALLLIIFVALRDRKFGWIKIDRKFWIILGTFVLVNTLACLFSVAPTLSFWGSYERQNGLLQFLYYVSFFLLFVSFFDKKEVKKILFWIGLVGFVMAVIAILQNYFGIFLSPWDTSILIGRLAIGTFGHPNFLASYLLMLMPFFLVFFCETKDWKKYLWLTALIIALWAIYLSLSRGAMVGLFIGTIFAGIFYKRKLLTVPIFLLALLLFANIFAGQNFVQNNRLLNRFVLRGDGLRSVESRLEIWPATLKMIAERPIFGYGQELFKESFEKFAPQKLLELEDIHNKADRAHNEILDLASSIGVVGLLSYLCLLFIVIKFGIKKYNNPLIFAGSTSLLVLFVNNMFEFSVTTNYTLWWLFLGIIVVLSGEKRSVNLAILKKRMTSYLFLIASVLIVLFISFFTIIKPIVADYYYNDGQTPASSLLYFNAVDRFKMAAEANPYEIYYDFRGAEFSLLGANNTLEDFYKNLLISQSEWFLQRAKNLGAENFAEFFHLKGRLMFLQNNPDSAIKFLIIASQKSPIDTGILLDLAEAYMQKKSPIESMRIYEKYLKLMPYWDKAFEIQRSDVREQFLFRIFFKSNDDFTDILNRIAIVAEAANLPAEAKKYRDYSAKIKAVMNSLTK